ncbi:MAG: hypothetical protein IJ307_06835 [Bacteroidales bacterium]|nr:hypothetical protein [Bacteroidales bacterium]
MNRIYFTADLHIGHTNILKHQPDRPFATEPDSTLHDEYMIDLWKSTVDKKDLIYILGDLTFLKSDSARKLLEKLPGRKYLVQGNHDGSLRAYDNYFQLVTQVHDMVIKPTLCPSLPENLHLTLCHYPMVTWNHKPRGSIMLHGHCHGKLDDYNARTNDLRFDVGIDSMLAKRCGGFIPVEAVYEIAREKTEGVAFDEYARKSYDREVR